MAPEAERVPYGYEPPAAREKGTLVYYDTFEDASDDEIAAAAAFARDRSFARLVLYPLHEETWRRMSKRPIAPYYRREERLREWLLEYGRDFATIDGWEGKRKKYTPIDAALRHLVETLPAPHFVYMNADMANAFASFSSFEDWIVRVRLVLSDSPRSLHPRLEKHRNRWETR